MRTYFTLLFLFVTCSVYAQRDYSSLVNPFIGTGGHGHTYPGASMPFGMMQLSPDTRMADWDGSSGYHYSDSVIYGFSHTHLSGTGIPDYCDLLFMPFAGAVKWKNSEYRSPFSHKNEKAEPGYYEVLLEKNKIKAQLSATLRSGIHQYSFPASATDAAILIDLEHRDQVLESWIEKISDYELRGLRRSRSWAQNQHLYFYIRFEKPIKSIIFLNDEGQEVTGTKAAGKHVKAAVRFSLDKGRVVRAKVGISGVDTDGARKNLDQELPGWDLEAVRKKARSAWNKELGKIEISGGTKDQQTVFYTALYHTFLVPNVYQDTDGRYRGTDLRVHQATGFTNYTVFSLWDTYRAYHPLMTLLNQKRTTDWINTFLAQYRQGGMLPVWELSGNETFCMIGYHSVPVIADAYLKGIRGFDARLAVEAMRSYAESNRYGLPDYMRHGYLSNDKEHESVSKTLEYAYDDWCIAQMAKATGNDSVFRTYIQRAQYYKNLFDPETHLLRGKIQSMWMHPFDPREINNYFTEGNAWQYAFAVPQDVQTLIALHCGKTAFAQKLEELFTVSSQTTGRQQADVTGLIGQYAQGNEPSHHMVYLFNDAGRPRRTQELVQQIGKEFYTNAPDGLIGNEDCGQLSAWYIWSAMGLYPLCPGSGQYATGIPLFDNIKLHLENGKTIVIRAQGRKPGTNYVNSMVLDGKPLRQHFITHQSLVNTSSLDFVLGVAPAASEGWASNPTVITEELIVPVPYFVGTTHKFRDSLQVEIRDIEPDAEIRYTVIENQELQTTGSQTVYMNAKYTGPFTIRRNSSVAAFARKKGKDSRMVSQHFFRIPDDRSVRVLSQVHPMYTAGGPDALIDGIVGTTNWRTGEWQSYFGQDLEAVVDLKTIRPVRYLGLHVLQDISPWILYPSEVIFYTSTDGVNYREAARIASPPAREMGQAEAKDMGQSVQTEARFVKVRAINGGKLPAWHESAGNPSHLFADEIIIR